MPLQLWSTSPAVWSFTSVPSFNRPAVGYAPFLTADQKRRLERVRQARMIYSGQHRAYFLGESRTQFHFGSVRVGGIWGDNDVQMYIPSNICGLISKKNGDLLFGEEPMLRVIRQQDVNQTPDIDQSGNPGQAVAISVQSDPQKDALDALAERSNLHQLFHRKAVDASSEGDSFFESVIIDGEVYVQEVPADEIFPVGKVLPNGQFLQYVRYLLKDVGSETNPIILLLKVTYSVGRVDRELYQLDGDGRIMGADAQGRGGKKLGLDQWPLDIGEEPIEALTRTGIDENTITWIPNSLFGCDPVSDYDGIVELQDELNAKQTQIARVLSKHADPKLAMPAASADRDGNNRSDYDTHYFRTKDEIPQYITWNAELEAAFNDRDFTEQRILIIAETALVLLGLQIGKSAKAASFKAMKLESYNSLSKAQRKSMYFRAGIKRVLTVAQKLEQTLPGVRYDLAQIGVVLRDGIPIDDLDQANRLSILRAAGGISLDRMVEEQLPDPAAKARELNELRREAAAQAAQINFDPSGDPNGSEGTRPLPGGLLDAPPANQAQAADYASHQSESEVAA